MSKHTLGPWKHDEVNRFYWKVSVAKKGGAYVICEVGPIEGQTEANARLIAAAPEMLEALQMALDDSEVMNPDGSARPISNYVFERMRAAIAKATGETK